MDEVSEVGVTIVEQYRVRGEPFGLRFARRIGQPALFDGSGVSMKDAGPRTLIGIVRITEFKEDRLVSSPEHPCPGCGAPTGYDRCLPCARRVPTLRSRALRAAASPDRLAPGAPSPAFSTGIG